MNAFKIGDIVKVINGDDMFLRDKIGRVLYVCDDKNMVVVKFTIIDQTRLGSKITQVRWLKCDDLKLAKHPELYVKVVLQSCQVKEIPQNFIDRLSKEDLMHFAYDADIFDYDEPNETIYKVLLILDEKAYIQHPNGMCFVFDLYGLEIHDNDNCLNIVDYSERNAKYINGEIVRVINNDRSYNTYSAWFKKYAPQYFSDYRYGEIVGNGAICQVLASGSHEVTEEMLYLIRVANSDACYLIDQYGLSEI